MADLYDHPLEFYVYGCTSGGSFDAEKATALGYNNAQHSVIRQYLADNPDGVKAALKKAEEWQATLAEAEPVVEKPVEEPPSEE